MQTLTLTPQDYDKIAEMAECNCHENFQIDYPKDDCVLYISMNHTEIWRKTIGTSFMGFDEIIGECVSDTYNVMDVECLNSNDEVVFCNFDKDMLREILN